MYLKKLLLFILTLQLSLFGVNSTGMRLYGKLYWLSRTRIINFKPLVLLSSH